MARQAHRPRPGSSDTKGVIMDSRFPAPEAHNIVNGVKNALAIYAYIAAVAFIIYGVLA